MNLVGWAADGFPMYYKNDYKDHKNTNSKIVQLKSSYVLKKGKRPRNGISEPSGTYTGKYVSDYEFQNNFGDLNECNGRTGVTPEFPKGTYYYVVSDEFPSASRCLMGTPSNDFKIEGSKRKPQQKQQKSKESQSSRTLPNFTKMLKKMDSNNDGKI